MAVMTTIAAVASVVAALYPIVDSIIKEKNSKKVAELRKDLDQILAKSNSKIEDYKKELERRGIKFNLLMDKLAYTSPSGQAAKNRGIAEKKYQQDVDTINSAINKVSNQINQYSALENEDINKLESKGVVRTIFNN